jgi:C4-dicarboxylate-binding protein DctP
MRGTVDGLITSYASAHSAKLVEAGLTYSVSDRQCMLHYCPMVSKKFWNSLPDDMRKLFVDVWNDHVPAQRAKAREMQKDGEDKIEAGYKKKGGSIWRPSPSTLKRWRERVMPAQEKLIEQLKLDRDLVAKAAAMLGIK